MPVFMLDERLLFPPVDLAIEGGILAVGGDLSPERLLLAYREGKDGRAERLSSRVLGLHALLFSKAAAGLGALGRATAGQRGCGADRALASGVRHSMPALR